MSSSGNRIAVALVASTLIGASLTACSVQATKQDCNFRSASTSSNVTNEVAVIESPTSNFTNFENVVDESKTAIRKAISNDGSQLSVIVADQQPKLIATSYTIFESGDTDADKDYTRKRAAGPIAQVAECATLEGNPLNLESESDLLAALGSAADTFSESAKTKSIFVLSNGIQTAGQYSMQVNGIPSKDDAPAVVEQLQADGALPDLTDVTVTWIGLGQTDGKNQRSLNQQSVDALENFWTLIIQAAGGKVGAIDREVVTGAPSAYSIAVTPIAGLKNACFFTVGSDAGFNFQPDSTEFVDVNLANEAARNIVAQVNTSGCVGALHLTGYVASGKPQSEFEAPGDVTLSLQRAEKFAQLLVAQGFIGETIAHGGGKGPENDWNADGSFNEEAGKLNRIVVISQ